MKTYSSSIFSLTQPLGPSQGCQGAENYEKLKFVSDTSDCKSQKAQAKKFTRLFIRANIKRSKYEQQFDLNLTTGKPSAKPETKPTDKPEVTAG